jgi:hypothetical protein
MNVVNRKGYKTKDLDSIINGPELIYFLKTQKGSRLMQNYIKKRSSEEIYAILEKIFKNIKDLMCDSYANYFIQKLLQCCTSNQRLKILQMVYITKLD